MPGTVWLLLFVLLPLCLMLGVSFLSRGVYGEVERPWTFENYRRLAGYDLLGFDPLYPIILGRSLGLALVTSAACVVAAIPFALYLARLGPRAKLIYLTALLIPVWTNLLVRTFAWQGLLAPDGLITELARGLGIFSSNEGLYPSWGAVIVCLVCDYFPFAALPIYAAAEQLKWSLVDAAQDLGAGRWQTFRHGIWPQIRAGVAAGLIFVLLPALGQFVIPDLLGGAKTVLLGNLLQQQFGISRDWPFGAAVTVVTMVVVLLGMGAYLRILRVAEEER